MKSGLVFLDIGGLTYDVTSGVPRSMYEEVVCIPRGGGAAAAPLAAGASAAKPPPPSQYVPLGRLEATLCVTPHIESLRERMDAEKAGRLASLTAIAESMAAARARSEGEAVG